ncbi:hypothetical protein RUMOBE_02231 [Blautia obeum ATCC 29174]|uniref:Uncharacterized protein n=1 Tax=Blautia obeum ATCC 29174 TaxID=411459 RepID=A5ZTA2_9FIRM|nr:hypothetical protein RUMOBE_02231 [Blautia obeum ATCC 29174]
MKMPCRSRSQPGEKMSGVSDSAGSGRTGRS